MSREHIDATGWWIAASLVADGRDPDWVRMVARENGHGDIDLDRAAQWMASGEFRCRCDACEARWHGAQPAPSPAPAPVQMTLF